jgi:tryptophanyl-tRNA synthetase
MSRFPFLVIVAMLCRHVSSFGRTSFPALRSTSRLFSSTETPAAAAAGATTTASTEPPRLKRVLSGVQPTGALHLGNYLGAIRQWVQNQDAYDNYFCVVDLHAITVPHDPKKLRAETVQSAAMYVASGIDPSRSKIFVQSHVRAHAELCWLLNCVTPMNWLERMIQFKEKAKKQGENVGVGLFGYPVLMAADILLYQADLVPVGEDQRQHLELTRDICRRFNDQYCKKRRNTFREPEALIVKEGARVMSLQDGTSKMSKSAENDNSRINLLDPPDVISKKIKKCKTDLFTGLEWDNPERPECTNLLNMYQAVTGRTREDILAEVIARPRASGRRCIPFTHLSLSRSLSPSKVSSMSWGAFKPVLADAVVAHIEPIQKRYNEVVADEVYLNKVRRVCVRVGEGGVVRPPRPHPLLWCCCLAWPLTCHILAGVGGRPGSRRCRGRADVKVGQGGHGFPH